MHLLAMLGIQPCAEAYVHVLKALWVETVAWAAAILRMPPVAPELKLIGSYYDSPPFLRQGEV
jgi:hypothetical protein